MGPGEVLSTLRAASWIRRFWDLASEKAKVEKEKATVEEDKRHLEDQKAKIAVLLQKDAEICSSPTHGITITAERLAYGYWRDADRLEILLNLTVVNPWAYSVTMDKLLGSVTDINGSDLGDLSYLETTEVDRFSAMTAPERRIKWTPTVSQQQALQISPDRFTDTAINVKLIAELFWIDGSRFKVSQQLQVPVLLRNRRS